MKLLGLLLMVIFYQDSVPFKPKDEFEIKLDFQFKQRPLPDGLTVDFTKADTEHKRSGPLPYLHLNINLLKVDAAATRMRIHSNKRENILTRKLDKNADIKLDLGFTDDIKDRVSAHEYIVYFFSAEKKIINRIIISFDEDGTYWVNEEKRGKI